MSKLIAALALFLIALAVSAEEVSYRTIRIVGRAESIVTSPQIKLGDIADITSPRMEDDESVLGLRKLVVATSPQPGLKATISGSEILERMKHEGVRLERVGYTLPNTLTVTRAYREITLGEIENALQALITESGREMQIKKIEYPQPLKVAPGAKPIKAIALRETQPGQIGIDLRSQDDSGEARFQLRAMVDEWRMIAIAKRSISKGVTLTGSEIEMRSYNASIIGRDAIEEPSMAIGSIATRDIGQGEPLRQNMISIPPVIAAGSKVLLSFKSGLLEASASGTALDNGATGQEIRVRNESSKKIINGRVVEPGLVRVGAGL